MRSKVRKRILVLPSSVAGGRSAVGRELMERFMSARRPGTGSGERYPAAIYRRFLLSPSRPGWADCAAVLEAEPIGEVSNQARWLVAAQPHVSRARRATYPLESLGRIIAVAVGVMLLTAVPTAAQQKPRVLIGAVVSPQREVTLTVSYLNPDPAVVPPTASDIAVLEGGKETGARLTHLPDELLEIVVILDTRRTDVAFAAMTTALVDLVAGLPPSATISVVTAGDEPAVADEPTPVDGWTPDDALEGLAPTDSNSVIEAFGLAMEQFSDRREPDGRRVVVAFADGYVDDPATVSEEV